MCKMDVAMLFLMLAASSDAIMAVEGDEDDSKVKSSSCQA